MSLEASPTMPLNPDAAEPKAENTAVPVWLFVVLLVLLYGCMVYFDLRGGWFEPAIYAPYHSVEELMVYQPPSGGNEVIQQGKRIYDSVCALCHNVAGTGNPNQAPPFAGSEWVQGSPNRLIRIPLVGLGGPITVHGQQYTFPASMPAMGAALKEEDLAAVLTYMRQAWGNKAPPITAEEVKAIKTQIGNRSQPFTPEEVMQVPEK
jgi:mono/diheme cytochrome c family protein